MTQKDIARKVGVAVSTVSRVLNDQDTKAASPKVKERIWQVVRQEGYTFSETARDLRKTKQRNIANRYVACVYALNRDNRDSFFAELASAIEYELFKHRYILKYSIYAGDMDVDTFADTLKDTEIAGLIIMGRFDNPQLRSVVEPMKNVVFVGLNYLTKTHDAVFCEAYKAAQCVMEEFYRSGHRQIAYIGEKSRERRYIGYQEFMADRKLAELSVQAKHSLDGGYHGAKAMLDTGQPFTGVFVANDEAAIGAIKAFREHSLRVPEDISVISVDDVEVARYFSPMLTTVHIPIRELGRQAARTLIDKIESGRKIPLKIELPFSLARRDSSAPFKKP